MWDIKASENHMIPFFNDMEWSGQTLHLPKMIGERTKSMLQEVHNWICKNQKWLQTRDKYTSDAGFYSLSSNCLAKRTNRETPSPNSKPTYLHVIWRINLFKTTQQEKSRPKSLFFFFFKDSLFQEYSMSADIAT